MSATIVLASSNPGKVREIARLLSGVHLTVVPQSSYDVPEAPETGLTFVENAILKARNARTGGRCARWCPGCALCALCR
jgi:XTP/dITP diphosphohydrolase